MNIQCNVCKKIIPIPISNEEFIALKKGKALIQDTYSNLSPGIRELMISGICEECFDEIFKDKEK